MEDFKWTAFLIAWILAPLSPRQKKIVDTDLEPSDFMPDQQVSVLVSVY